MLIALLEIFRVEYIQENNRDSTEFKNIETERARLGFLKDDLNKNIKWKSEPINNSGDNSNESDEFSDVDGSYLDSK